MKQVFLKVRELLNEITELRFVDLDKGQIDNYETRPAVAFPCALIKIDLPRCEDLNSKVQTCAAVATIRLAFDYTGETSGNTPDAALASALAYFDLAEKVYNKFQGYSGDGLAPFSRKSVKEEMRRDGLKVLLIPFDTEFKDKTAV